MTGYLLKVKYFPNIVTPQKPRGGVATTPSLYHGGGISLRVRPTVNTLKLKSWQLFPPLRYVKVIRIGKKTNIELKFGIGY